MKISNEREFYQVALYHLSDIEFKDFIKLFKDYTKGPFSILVNDTSFLSENPLTFRKNLF